ncbi:family 43 glycosylhydrolase [Niabella yanshanensis]|uniref:Family 43 glycosylhydrolase n=1 Tax=Niabella yanshanensis TaxID=577386 RepID=A0ABZ0WAZ4_9BACT|nr:family 43 glycosylhydrolase [Niabella yanshanensis]WQD39799.1 family 43 glycosylhydrolase [Niabella yanshanensis]
MMKNKQGLNSVRWWFYGAIVTSGILLSCSKAKSQRETPAPEPLKPVAEYQNPVFTPILADPTVIKDPNSDYYYAYGTEDFWHTDNKNHLVAVVRSRDLINWTYVNDAFTSKPTWKSSGGIWAPDIAIVNGKYHLYYSYSTWGDANPGIGLAVSSYPAGPFIDAGKLFLSSEIGVPNSIDPFYYEESGKKYLFWGSYNTSATQGTYGVELTEDGRRVKDAAQKIKIAAGDFEAVNLFRKDGYYYFFGSKNNCCDGAASVYQVRVGRSRNLMGPYIDKAGKNLTERGAGTLVLQRNSQFSGPGHNARLITDKKKQDWMLYHAMDVERAMINTVNQRALLLDKVNWDADGWPVVNDGTPSAGKMKKPEL